MKLYRTTDMHRTARWLAERHKRVLVRADKRIVQGAIRFRPVELFPIRPLWAKYRYNDMAEWEKRGGVMLYYLAQRADQRLPKHDAQLLVEAPFSVEQLMTWIADAGYAVMYKPPSWKPHLALLEARAAPRKVRIRHFTLRIEPTAPYLLEPYRYLRDHCPDGIVPVEAPFKNWKNAISILKRRGYIRVDDETKITTLPPKEKNPELARRKFEQVIALVEAAPDIQSKDWV